jgi:hypothetical protein
MALSDVYRVQISLGMDSNLPEDAATNTLHFEYVHPDPITEAKFNTGVRTPLNNFYTSLATQGILSSAINPANITYKAYRITDLPPSPPEYTGNITIGGMMTGVAAPPELSVCLSYKAPNVLGGVPARRRGRIYVGPLGFLAGATVPSTQQQAIRDAGAALLSDVTTAGQFLWVVYSPTANAAYTVESGWVDNAWDVQRRRGTKSSARITF